MKAFLIMVSIVIAFNPISVKASAPMTTTDYAEEIGIEESEFIFISSVVEAESDRSDDIEGRIYIALTILNRVNDDRFNGDTITEILNAPGQFSTVRNGHSVTNRTELSDEAVFQAWRWINEGDAPEVLFFNCRGYNYGEPYAYIGGNYFMTMGGEQE